jgi:hypothetical protein
MKNTDADMDDDLRPEYDLKRLRVRRVGPGRATSDQHGVLLDPDVAAVFPDSQAVNEAPRFLIRVSKQTAPTLPPTGTAG